MSSGFETVTLISMSRFFPIARKTWLLKEFVDEALTVDPWADVKNGFTWKIIIVLKVRGGHGE